MPEGGADAVRRRDEILQALYWLEGEGLTDRVSSADLGRVLARPGEPGSGSSALEQDLDVLVEAGLVVREDGSIRLTNAGSREGARRFADAFGGMTGQAHGECSDPDCACHTDPEAALECHRERTGAAP